MPDTLRDPAWLAGYRAAVDPPDVLFTPLPLDECGLMDFVTGFLVGARDRRNADLMDALVAGE